MIGGRQQGLPIGLAALLLLIGVWSSRPAGAAEPARYEYMRVQGRIAELPAEAPVAGLVVRIRAGPSVFETATDARGVFLFEEVPVAAYEVEVSTVDGKALRAPKRLTSAGADRTRVKFRLDRGPATALRVEPAGERVTVTVPRRTEWGKHWAELSVFAAIALLLAL